MRKQLSDLERVSYIEGSASASVAGDIVRSRYERNRVAELRDMLDELRQELNPAACPDTVMLGEFHLDTLDLVESFMVSAHVRTCAHCQSRLANLANYVNDVQTQRMFLYPVASTGMGQSALAYRASTQDAVTEYTYKINHAEINLSLQRSATVGKHAVLGLVTGLETGQSLVATLHKQGDSAESSATKTGLEATVDLIGSFSFDVVESGTYELTIHGAQVDYVLRGISI